MSGEQKFQFELIVFFDLKVRSRESQNCLKLYENYVGIRLREF